MAKRVKPGDFVYTHYSGHGSQVPDLNGDERSGYDQTWVSYGSRVEGTTGKDKYDVLDDEINAWLAAIYAKTDQVIFVSDSCHSATVTRGKAPISRGLTRDDRSHPLGKITYTQLDKYQGIHVGAARDDELAAETIGTDGKQYGLFTWNWAKALRQAQVGETWSDVFKRAYTPVVSKYGQAQMPQMEGERNRQVFGGDFAPLAKTISVTQVEGERVEIQAGAMAGVTVGSVYHLYQPQASNNLPQLEITQVEAFKSSGKITLGTFKRNDLVVEKSHAYHFDPIKVYLSADYPDGKDQPLLQKIRAAFIPDPDAGTQAIPGYTLTDDPYNANLRLQLLRPKRKNGQPIYENDALPKSFPNQPPELWVLTPEQHLLYNNLQIQFHKPSRGLELLQKNLNKLARIREIKALESHPHGATSPVLVQSYLHTPVKICPNGANCVELPHGLGLHEMRGPISLQKIGDLSKNDILTFTLHNQSDQDYYSYLINIGADGAISTIFPVGTENMESARIKAGEKWELGDKGMLMVVQSGEETLKLITSTRPFDVLLLEQEKFQTRASTPLGHLLVNAMQGLRGVAHMKNVEWVTGQVTFEVK